MYRKIIVGYDGSDQAKDALALGKDLSQTTGAELCVGGVFLFHPLLAQRRRPARSRGGAGVRGAAGACG